MIGANSVVPPYRYIPAHQLWVGNPVRFVKDLSKQEMASMRFFRSKYLRLKETEAQDALPESSAFLEKEILDDIEADMKNENITVDDLEAAINLMEQNGLEIFFAKKLVAHAREKLGKMKSVNSTEVQSNTSI